MDTFSGLLFDNNIYFENAHLENILKIINIFLENARSRPSSSSYDIFQVEKGERGEGDYSSLDTVSGLLFDYNIYFENAHLETI